MSVLDWFRRPRLVSVAVFADRAAAEEAWALLQDAGIPASVETDPGALGSPVVSRIMVEEPDVARAQQAMSE